MSVFLDWLKAVVLLVFFGAAIALFLELAWNNVVPSLFHGPMMNFQEAYCVYTLLLLVASVFKVLDIELALLKQCHVR